MDDITWDRNEKSDANLNSEEAKLQSAELFTPYVIGLVANLPMAIIGKLPDDLKPQFEDFSSGIRDADTRNPSAKLKLSYGNQAFEAEVFSSHEDINGFDGMRGAEDKLNSMLREHKYKDAEGEQTIITDYISKYPSFNLNIKNMAFELPDFVEPLLSDIQITSSLVGKRSLNFHEGEHALTNRYLKYINHDQFTRLDKEVEEGFHFQEEYGTDNIDRFRYGNDFITKLYSFFKTDLEGKGEVRPLSGLTFIDSITPEMRKNILICVRQLGDFIRNCKVEVTSPYYPSRREERIKDK